MSNATALVPSSATARRIVTEQRGSWRWQDAFRIATYEQYTTRDGRLVWRSVDRSRKLSLPQIRALGLGGLRHGSLHHKPVLAPHVAAEA